LDVLSIEGLQARLECGHTGSFSGGTHQGGARHDHADAHFGQDGSRQCHRVPSIVDSRQEIAFAAHALHDIVRALGRAQLAKDTGLNREALYKAHGKNSNFSFRADLKVMKAPRVKQRELRHSSNWPDTADAGIQ